MSMRRSGKMSIAALMVVVAVVPLGVGGSASGQEVPDPAFLEQVPGAECTPESAFEKKGWAKTASAQAGDLCKRIKFAFGPITVKPGQNDVLIGPVTIEKPAYDGMITRFQPDLVDETGQAPPIDVVHLHHATWLNAGDSYGNGPFFAAGEEKTVLPFPRGYGMQVNADDKWLLLYMVHSEVVQPKEVWITYDMDFVATEDAEEVGLVPTKPIWLDVQHEPIAKGAPDTSGNPVFNVQKGFGSYSKEYGQKVCTWPKQNCARHDMYGNVTPQQGKPIDIQGADWKVPKDMAGTIVTMGGHLHPGGIADEVSLVRDGKEKMIHISDALYWDRKYKGFDAVTGDLKRKRSGRAGGPANSWDFSMTGTGAFLDWKVKIEPGDILRLNAVYDSQDASWYENMGIVMAWVAPKDPYAPAGVDVFEDNVKIDRGVPKNALTPPGWRKETCTPDLKGPQKTLCLRGQVTHGHLEESNHFGGCRFGKCPPLPKKEGPLVTDLTMEGFTYGLADMGVIEQNGIPRVKAGEPFKFWNADSASNIWHTATRCAAPCTGETGMDYPLADGGIGSPKDVMDFDSTEIGYGVFFSPASGQFGSDKPFDEAIRDGAYWEFTPTKPGIYTFYCRIHHSMRGAFEVVK
ncbi:MAG: cupredoxin domain-containing protein [Actinomycetota bacterium]